MNPNIFQYKVSIIETVTVVPGMFRLDGIRRTAVELRGERVGCGGGRKAGLIGGIDGDIAVFICWILVEWRRCT